MRISDWSSDVCSSDLTFLAKVDPGVRVRLDARLDEGETGTAIVRGLADAKADLLVLGTHGRSGFAHATIGSQAEALLASVNVDVLMVRESSWAIDRKSVV